MPQNGTTAALEQSSTDGFKGCPNHPFTPNIALGLTMIDAPKEHNLRIRSYVDNLKGYSFKIHIGT